AASASPRNARIASTVLADTRTYRSWEVRHADLLLPVARQRNNRWLLTELRNAQIQLVHQRALFRYLRNNEIQGAMRARLFRLFHSTLDFESAVLFEHRQFMLAQSSRISADHITDIMHDRHSPGLLTTYEKQYERYFELKCYLALARDRNCIDMVRPMLREAHMQLARVRRRFVTEPPEVSSYSFDLQDALARSGRYEALNYMVG
ncbi:MAG TPA: hypothetical protein VFE85_04770, partial [Woeseiaceae bacterium]|nr:hypothetical protein [Woeseiaceae bacterium]